MPATRPPAGKRTADDPLSPARRSLVFFLLACALSLSPSLGQVKDSLAVNKKRLTAFAAASGAGYGISLVGLHQLWYRDFSRRHFHFFNDNAEWKQVDKAGHIFSAYYLGYATARTLRSCHVPGARSDLIGAITGFAALVPIEIFDGYSTAYGASAGDLIANAGGAALFLGQQALWNEQRLIPKFSFHYTPYPALRPEVLGNGSVSEILKDYNGQTYWLSADLDRFGALPRWLNLAVGYGGQAMVFARDHENALSGYTPYRQLYLALDPDLTSIRTRSRLLKGLIFIASMIKLPAPALEWSRGRLSFHPLYF